MGDIMNQEHKIGIVTVFYNAVDILEDFFYSLSIQTYKNFILIAIDNESADKSVINAKHLAEKYHIDMLLIESGGNMGVAYGDAFGSKKAIELGCKYVLLSNNDIRIKKENVIEKMVQRAEKTNEYILVPKIYYYDTNIIWMAGGWIKKWTARTPHRGDREEDTGQYDDETYVEYAPTCFTLFNTDLFKDIGFPDEKYFVYYNDTDIVYRANKEGYRTLYMPSVSMEHKVSVSTGGSESSFYIYYSSRNRLYFIRKNFTGIQKYFALTYYLITRVIKLPLASKEKRKNLYESVIAGFKM